MKLDPPPMVALLPLGTGNDLGRTLGYGAAADTQDVKEILKTISERTQPARLDRWKVTLTPLKGDKADKTGREIFIQNYLSVGVDALVTYNFHRTRENARIPFSGRLYNKLLYFIYGTKDVLERECKGEGDKRLLRATLTFFFE